MLLISPTLHIVRARSRRGLVWAFADADAEGRWLTEMILPPLLDDFLSYIELARRYRPRPFPLVYWVERDGWRSDRIATFRMRADDHIEVLYEHLGERYVG